MNKFYDIIATEYKKYSDYNTFYEKEKEAAKEKRIAIMKSLMDSEEVHNEVPERYQEQLFDILLKDRLYATDIQLIFHNLYTLVKTYQQLEDVMVLPKEITDLCTQMEHVISNTIFVTVNGAVEERERGKFEKIKEEWKKSAIYETTKKQIEEQLKNAPQQ